MNPRDLNAEDIARLPVHYRTTVTAEHLDHFGHLNVRWYYTFFDEGAMRFITSLGMGEEFIATHNVGFFLLRQVINYVAEVREGETVTVHCRMIDRGPKRFHKIYFLVNETHGKLAATMENLVSAADLTARRTTTLPDETAAVMDALIAEHRALPWAPPVSGIMAV